MNRNQKHNKNRNQEITATITLITATITLVIKLIELIEKLLS